MPRRQRRPNPLFSPILWISMLGGMHALGWLVSIWLYHMPEIRTDYPGEHGIVEPIMLTIASVLAGFFWQSDLAMSRTDFDRASPHGLFLFLFFDLRMYILIAMAITAAIALITFATAAFIRR